MKNIEQLRKQIPIRMWNVIDDCNTLTDALWLLRIELDLVEEGEVDEYSNSEIAWLRNICQGVQV